MGAKIQTTTALGLLCAGLFPLIVLLGLFALSTRSELQEAALEDRCKLTARLAREVEGLLDSLILDLNLISSDPLLVHDGIDFESRITELERLSHESRFSELRLFDHEGYLVAASDDVAVSRDRSPWFERCIGESTTVVSDPIRNASGNELSVFVYRPVPPDLGSEIAVVCARIGLGSVWAIIDDLAMKSSGNLFLVDANANILYSAERDQIFEKADQVIGDVPFARLRGNGPIHENAETVFVGHLVRPSFQLAPSRAWGLIWRESKDHLFDVLHSIYRHLFVGATLGLLSAVSLGLFIERRLSRPILAMCDVASRAAGGARGLRMVGSRSRELSTLSDSFNEMMDSLEGHNSQLEGLVEERTAELQETISQLRQSQKLEAVGLMAGGIAHDFNNLLTAINGNVSLAIQEIGDSDEFPDTVEQLRLAGTAGEKAAGVVRQLLAYSRKEELQLRHEDINGLVAEIREIVEHTFDPRIKIVSNLAEGRLGIEADCNQIGQVLMNLCINAKDAMGEQGGTITLATGSREISSAGENGHGSPPGEYTFIQIADSGVGIPEAHLKRIFEPFFTTKAPNKGSGLGLAMCYGIITQHGGWIECNSEIGKGTTFVLFLPRHYPAEEEAGAEVAGAQSASEPARRNISGATILLADDEPAVRAIAEAVLSKQGCRILSADNGQEALDLCAERQGQISLAILDGAMPVLSGQETFAVLARDYPDLPVIICSGNVSEEDSFRSPSGRYPDAFLLKPYQFEQLIGQVEALANDWLPS